MRIENFGGFGHEVDTGKDDDIGVGVGGFAGEFEGVTDVVSDILNIGVLVVVSEDDSVEFLFEGMNGCKQVAGKSCLGEILLSGCGCKHSWDPGREVGL